MTIVTLSLPDQMSQYLEERVNEGGYSTPGEFVRDLIREDQKRRAQERLETLLLEGLDSGTPIEVTDDYIQQKRAELLSRLHEGGESAC